MRAEYDAVVVGSGPNGLAAAITIAREGYGVLLIEAHETLGGGMRSGELTLPGFNHDVCAAVFPVGIASPFFRSLRLEAQGLRWIEPPSALAHPLDDGTAAVLTRSLDETAGHLGRDGMAWQKLFAPHVVEWRELTEEVLQPIHLPRHPWVLARFGYHGIRSARALIERHFRAEPARALFAGLAGHSVLPLHRAATASFGLYLGILGHAIGWPIIEGGAQQLTDALARIFRGLGGQILSETPVRSLDQLPRSRVVLLDVTPRQFVAMAGEKLSSRARSRYEAFAYGAGVFKVDFALSQPIPWKARACNRASTVHVGGTYEEIAAAEAATEEGSIAEKPFVLVSQPSVFDLTRAPRGNHTVWAYCHLPNGCTTDRMAVIESQIERFAPGFRDVILARSGRGPRELERYNPNCVGGDVTGGSNRLSQLFTRPLIQRVPYATPIDGVYLCSASTPPGGGVHGMCGYHAARTALRRELGGTSRLARIPDNPERISLTRGTDTASRPEKAVII